MADDAARLKAMVDAGDVDGVYTRAIHLLRGGIPEMRVLARVISRKVDTGVNAKFRKSGKARRGRGRPQQSIEHREIALDVFQTRARLIAEGKSKAVALRLACRSVAPKHNLVERTVLDIFQKSDIAKDDRFLPHAARW